MNIKPTFQQIFNLIGATQDGHKINPEDEYGKFLLTLIINNTKSIAPIDSGGEVDTEELASNLRYALHEFSKALKVVEKLNND